MVASSLNFYHNRDLVPHLNDNLSKLAKQLFEYWFVQFDFPDEFGRPYKSSGGKMVWNDILKQEVPEGWEISDLTKKISITRGVAYSPKDELNKPSENTVYLLKSNNIDNGAITYDKPVILDKGKVKSEHFLTKGSVFITMSSGSKAHMGKTAIVYFDMNYVFGAFCSKISISRECKNYLSMYFRSIYFRKYIEKITSGTNINNISNEHLLSIKLPFPPKFLQQKFEQLIDIYFEKIALLIKEHDQLYSLRDFILPLLMNGQATISD